MGLFGRKSVERLSAKGDVAGLVDVLAEAASKEDLEAHKAAAALLELGRPGIDALVGALRDPSACAVAAVSLGAATDPAVVGPLVEALGDPDSGVRGWAARALAKRDEPEAVEALAGALDDTSEGVREIAARGLGKRGDARALDVLIDQILRDPFMEAYEVAPMLGAIGDSRAVPALKKVLRARITPVGRQHALDALKAIGGSDTEAVLAKEEPLSELDAIKEALQQLPVVYATRATVLGPGAGQAAEQIPIICRNIDDAIAALRTGKDPGGEPIEARQVGLGLQNLVDDVSGPAFSGWMLTALDPRASACSSTRSAGSRPWPPGRAAPEAGSPFPLLARVGLVPGPGAPSRGQAGVTAISVACTQVLSPMSLLRPGTSAFTFAPPSRRGQRPFGA